MSEQVEHAIQIIEKLLKDWNIPPETVKDKGGKNIWYLKQGSADFHIELFTLNKGEGYGIVDCIEVGGTIMKVPQANVLPLYKKLLEMNSTAVGIYFALRWTPKGDGLIMLLSTREVAGIDYNELKIIQLSISKIRQRMKDEVDILK